MDDLTQIQTKMTNVDYAIEQEKLKLGEIEDEKRATQQRLELAVEERMNLLKQVQALKDTADLVLSNSN